MKLALTVLIGLTIYGSIASFVGVSAYFALKARRNSDAEAIAGVLGAFWPVGIWFMLSMRAMRRVEDHQAFVAAEAKERAKLIEAAHRELETGLPMPGRNPLERSPYDPESGVDFATHFRRLMLALAAYFDCVVVYGTGLERRADQPQP